jgi:hypothetical protein
MPRLGQYYSAPFGFNILNKTPPVRADRSVCSLRNRHLNASNCERKYHKLFHLRLRKGCQHVALYWKKRKGESFADQTTLRFLTLCS